MPMGAVTVNPGVNTQLTPAANEAGVSQSQLVRYRQGLIEKLGGWANFNSITNPSTVRKMHPWGGINSGVTYLGLGGTSNLSVYRSDVGVIQTITPQTETRDIDPPSFSVVAGSNLVSIVDANSSATTYQAIYFNTQVNVGGILLQGGYRINTVNSASLYTILATANATTTVSSGGTLPKFTTTNNSAIVTVTLPNHGYQAITGLYQQFIAPTTISTNSAGTLIIQGAYQVQTVIDTTSFTIALTQQASAAIGPITMNASKAELVYYRTQEPLAAGSGFGFGGFGSGGFGSGSALTGGTGTPIATTEWTMDNWGSVLIACPKDGPIYVWNPASALTTADVVATAPFFNGGCFVAMPQQFLVAWRSVQSTGVQSPLVVRWSNQADYTNWAVTSQTLAGSFTIPTGSKIVGGIQAPTQAVISTDIDVWAMQYVGGNTVFSFNRLGSGCAWIGPHAAGIQGGNLYWCSNNGFFMLSRGGVQDVPCPVWDFLFQNLNTSQSAKIQAAPNAMFNEIAWYFPSINATECDSYVKLNVADGSWDFGTLSRTAWTDASLIGNAMGVDSNGVVWQHEITHDAGGTPMQSSFRSGYWRIQEGEELAFVDFIIPDMKFAPYAGGTSASVQITFYVTDYLGDTPRAYGPYLFTNTTEYITTRIRGRYMAVNIASADSGSFWRLGKINYRWAVAGRR